MTREVINNLPVGVRKAVESYRTYYALSDGKYKNEAKERMCGYAKGLRDAGLLTERERQVVVVYMFSKRMDDIIER